MKKSKNLKIILLALCLTSLIAAAVVTASQISLDTPASLPSDI